MSHIPVEYQRKETLSGVFAQWNPNIVLNGDTAIIAIADPSAVMGVVRACCESVAGEAVSIEYPAELRNRLASGAVHRERVTSLPPAKLAYFGTVHKDQNVTVHIDQDVLHITGPKHACLEYKGIVEAASLHTVDSNLDPEVVRLLSTSPAKESLNELAKSCQCACFEPEASSTARLTIVSESEADADACIDKLARRYTVESISSADHAILHTDAKNEWEYMKDCIELEKPGIRILLEVNTVKLVGEREDITSIKQPVQEHIFQFLVTDKMIELHKDHFEVMKHSSKWCEVEDFRKQLDCKIIQHQSAKPNHVCIRVRGKAENVKTILGRINEMQKSLVFRTVQVDKPGIQKVFRSDSCRLLSRLSPGCSAQITCGSVQPLRDVFQVERGKLSSQSADALVNSSNDGLQLKNGQIATDLAAVAGPALQRECSQYVRDHSSLQRGDIAVTGPGNLQAQCVIHGNVMIYSTRRAQDSVASLWSVVQKALEVCDSCRLQSIAFPAIGIGILKFPLAVAVETLVGCAVDYIVRNRSTTSIKKVILVGFEERAHDLFLSTVEERCGVSHAGTEPERHSSEGVHPPPETVPDYPDLNLPELQLDPPPRGTPPLGTPLEFSILAESDYHCSQAEAELQQKVDEVLQRKVVENESIEQLPTSFLTAFQANAKAAHVKVTMCHNPARAELYGPKEDVRHAESVLGRALDVVANHLTIINMQASSNLQQYQWKYTSGSEGLTTSYSPEQCYALEKARQLQRKTASFKREGGGQVTVDMERLVEVGAGAARTTQVYRVWKEKGFPRPESWEGRDIVVEVEKTSEEFKRVATEFESSVKCRVRIVKIERIQNDQLWQAYQANKQDVMRYTTTAERMLYHGCPGENVGSIYTNGFTAGFAGASNATAFGRGIYFARDASYSADDKYSKKDKKGHKHIYRCCVLTGVFKRGNSSMRAPPQISPSNHQWCHSTVNDERNPTVFVVYDKNMVFPEHLITFTRRR